MSFLVLAISTAAATVAFGTVVAGLDISLADAWSTSGGATDGVVSLSVVVAGIGLGWLLLTTLAYGAVCVRAACVELRRSVARATPVCARRLIVAALLVGIASPVAASTGLPIELADPANAPEQFEARPIVLPFVSDDIRTTVYEVRPGDHFWRIATAVVEERGGPDRNIAPYWVRLIETNRDRIRSGDPDLIYPGEELVVP